MASTSIQRKSYKHQCERCGYCWISTLKHPVRCANKVNCANKDWNKPAKAGKYRRGHSPTGLAGQPELPAAPDHN